MRRFTGGLLLCSMSALAIAANVRVSLELNQDGIRSEAYPCLQADRSDCAPPTTGTLGCSDSAAASLSGQTVSTSFSESQRQWLTGSLAATAPLCLRSIGGSDAATTGWAITGDNLTISSATTGIGELQVFATDGANCASGNIVNCSIRNWSRNAASSDGGVAPSIPTGLAYAAATNSVTLSGDCSSDPPPTAARLKQINLRFNGTGATTAVTSCGAGLSRTLTQTLIGSSDGTPASSQVGTAISLGFGGSGWDSTADNFLFFEDTTGISGDAYASATYVSLASSASFPKETIMARESDAVGSKFVACSLQKNGKLQLRYRATDGAASANALNQSITLGSSIAWHLVRSGDNFTCEASDNGGVTWNITGATVSLPMTSSIYWGAALTSTSAGVNATASLTNWSLNNASRWSYVKSTGSTVTVDATAQDNDDNISSYTASAITAIPVAIPQKKWHPGNYMQVLRGATDTNQATRFGYYDLIKDNTDLAGVGVFFRWAQLEGATTGQRGDYTAGIALVQAEVNKLKGLTVPKRLAIRVMDEAFGSTCPASSYFPAYLNTAGKLVTSSNQCVWKKWDSEAMGWFIDMMNAYAAAFDNEAYVEIISPFHETAPGNVSGSDYTYAAYDAQTRRLSLAMAAAWPQTNIWIPTNFFPNGTNTQLASLASYLNSIAVGAGECDVCVDCSFPFDQIIRGAIGGHDYRGEIGNFMSAEVSEMGQNSVGPTGGYTPAQIFSHANGTQHANHLFWDRNTFAGTSNQQWAAILTFLTTHPITQTTCPSSYTQGCDTN